MRGRNGESWSEMGERVGLELVEDDKVKQDKEDRKV